MLHVRWTQILSKKKQRRYPSMEGYGLSWSECGEQMLKLSQSSLGGLEQLQETLAISFQKFLGCRTHTCAKKLASSDQRKYWRRFWNEDESCQKQKTTTSISHEDKRDSGEMNDVPRAATLEMTYAVIFSLILIQLLFFAARKKEPPTVISWNRPTVCFDLLTQNVFVT